LREQVPSLLQQVPHLSWKRVKAHATNKDNNMVDLIARKYALKMQKELPIDFVPPAKQPDTMQPNLFS
jgi:ribonuclease HI